MDEDIMNRIPPELSGVIKEATKDPRFSEILKMVAESTGASNNPFTENAETSADTHTNESFASENDNKGASPQIMSMLPGLLSMFGGSGGSDGKLSALGGGNHGMSEDKKRLLKAMKPFLNEKRSSAVDSILKIYEITNITSVLGSGILPGNGK